MVTKSDPAPVKRKTRWLAYVFSPQVLLGGVLAWFAATAWDYYKENRSQTAEVLKEVRGAMAPHIIPTPQSLDAATKAIEALKRIADLHENQRAKDLVNTQIAHLYWVRDGLERTEQKEREAAEKLRLKEEAIRKETEAQRALAESEDRRRAQREEELRKQQEAVAAAKALADAAARQAAIERADAARAQRAFDRAPK